MMHRFQRLAPKGGERQSFQSRSFRMIPQGGFTKDAYQGSKDELYGVPKDSSQGWRYESLVLG